MVDAIASFNDVRRVGFWGALERDFLGDCAGSDFPEAVVCAKPKQVAAGSAIVPLLFR